MKVINNIFLVAISMIMISNSMPAQDSEQNASKDVKIKYLENIDDGNPIADALIWFAYLDIKSSTWETDKMVTNTEGYANFKVPIRESGDSYAFIYATNEIDFNEKLMKAKDGKIFLWKIPADDTIKYLEIWIDKSNKSSNKVGSLQMCTT